MANGHADLNPLVVLGNLKRRVDRLNRALDDVQQALAVSPIAVDAIIRAARHADRQIAGELDPPPAG